MNYAICLLDKAGRTKRTYFGPHESDDAALTEARREVPSSPIVEIWKGEALLERLYRDPTEAGGAQ